MVNHELWRLVASGFLDTLFAELAAVTGNDTRARLIDYDAFDGKLLVAAAAPASLGYVPEAHNVRLLWNAVQNPVTDPQFNEDMIPLPENARVDSGTTLMCDNVPVDLVAHVFEWEDFRRFVLLGDLAGNDTPGAGTYVLVLYNEDSNIYGYPSLFLTIS